MALQEANRSLIAISRLRLEPALADARLARDDDDAASSVDEPAEGLFELPELGFPANERARWLPRRGLAGAGDPEGRDSRRLALELDLAERLQLERGLHLPCRPRPDHDLAQRLQAGGDVDGFAERVVEDVGW